MGQAARVLQQSIALLQPVPGERFTVPAYSPTIGNFSVIGVFYKPADDDVQRPTLVVCSGYDGSQEELYHNIVRNGLARGLNVVTYEGPGQPTVRRTQKIGFIPDWWNVVTPIIDYLATRSDVDMSKIANWGQSFGGSLAPIAASQEHRPSALIAIEGLASIQQAIAVSNKSSHFYCSKADRHENSWCCLPNFSNCIKLAKRRKLTSYPLGTNCHLSHL